MERTKSLLGSLVVFIAILGLSCQQTNVNGVSPVNEVQSEIDRLRAANSLIFDNDKEQVVFEGTTVTRENQKTGKRTRSVSYAYIDSKGAKVRHGLVRFYRDDKVIFEEILRNGVPDQYVVYLFPDHTLQVVFKNGKPWNGVFPVLGHGIFGIKFVDGSPVMAVTYDDNGKQIEILFDIGNSKTRDGQPWNGKFISFKNKTIDRYVDGNLVESLPSESVVFVVDFTERFNSRSLEKQ